MFFLFLWCCFGVEAGTNNRPLRTTVLVAPTELPRDTADLIALLVDQKRGPAAVEALIKKGHKVVPALARAASSADDTLTRGHAIQALAGIEGDWSDAALRKIAEDKDQAEIVRTWSGAALVARADSLDALLGVAPLTKDLVALKEPLAKQVVGRAGELDDLRGALTLAAGSAEVQQALLPAIQAKGARALVVEVLGHPDQEPRRLAAGILAGISVKAKDREAVIAAYAPNPKAKKPPWDGGALYVPSMGYARNEARTLAGHLVDWYAWCDAKGLTQEKQQVFNNLRSVGIWRQAGIRSGPPYNASGEAMRNWLSQGQR